MSGNAAVSHEKFMAGEDCIISQESDIWGFTSRVNLLSLFFLVPTIAAITAIVHVAEGSKVGSVL